MANGLPEVPERFDFVWRLFVDPCDAPFTLWFQKFWPALGQLVLELYALDLMNSLTEYLRPRTAPFKQRKSRHWGGGEKGKRDKFGRTLSRVISFDPGSWLGERLPGSEDLLDRPMPPGTIHLWTLFGALERFLYFILLIDLISAFAYRWGSSVISSKYCDARDDAVLSARFEFFDQVGIFGWSPIVWTITDKERRMTFWNSAGFMQSTGVGIATARYTLECLEGVVEDPLCALRFRCLGGPRNGKEVISIVHGTTGFVGVQAISVDVQEGELWIAEIIVAGFWRFTDGDLYVHARNQQTL